MRAWTSEPAPPARLLPTPATFPGRPGRRGRQGHLSPMRCLLPFRRALLGLLCAALLAPALVAQAPQQPPAQKDSGDLVLHAYTMRYRQASDAVSMVFPLLSQRGTVELQPATNTLVIRD